jgi:hypothetical protein
MPLTVALQNIYNKKLEEIVPSTREVEVFENWLPLGNPTYPMLQYIDEYGNTIFNGLQMRGFLVEWARLIATLNDPNQSKVALEIRRLAEKCRTQPHTFLRFIGD